MATTQGQRDSKFFNEAGHATLRTTLERACVEGEHLEQDIPGDDTGDWAFKCQACGYIKQMTQVELTS